MPGGVPLRRLFLPISRHIKAIRPVPKAFMTLMLSPPVLLPPPVLPTMTDPTGSRAARRGRSGGTSFWRSSEAYRIRHAGRSDWAADSTKGLISASSASRMGSGGRIRRGQRRHLFPRRRRRRHRPQHRPGSRDWEGSLDDWAPSGGARRRRDRQTYRLPFSCCPRPRWYGLN